MLRFIFIIGGNMSRPLCKNCKYSNYSFKYDEYFCLYSFPTIEKIATYKDSKYIVVYDYIEPKPNQLFPELEAINLVDGSIKATVCEIMREAKMPCGLDGNLYEENINTKWKFW